MNLKFYLWTAPPDPSRPVGPDGQWLVRGTFPWKGRTQIAYIMPLDPGDGWSPVGQHTLADQWTAIPLSEVPAHVREAAESRPPPWDGSMSP